MKCKICNEIIPSNNVQQGNCHMGCFNAEIELYKICIDSSCYYDKELPPIEELNDYSITKVIMTEGEYLYMPEFQGF